MLVTLHQPLYFSRGFREGGESCDDEIIVFMTETREKYLCPFILMPNIINARNSCDCHCLKKLYVDKSLWRNILKLTIPCDWFYLCRHLLMTMYICVSTYLWHWTALFLCGLVSWRPPVQSDNPRDNLQWPRQFTDLSRCACGWSFARFRDLP